MHLIGVGLLSLLFVLSDYRTVQPGAAWNLAIVDARE